MSMLHIDSGAMESAVEQVFKIVSPRFTVAKDELSEAWGQPRMVLVTVPKNLLERMLGVAFHEYMKRDALGLRAAKLGQLVMEMENTVWRQAEKRMNKDGKCYFCDHYFSHFDDEDADEDGNQTEGYYEHQLQDHTTDCPVTRITMGIQDFYKDSARGG